MAGPKQFRIPGFQVSNVYLAIRLFGDCYNEVKQNNKPSLISPENPEFQPAYRFKIFKRLECQLWICMYIYNIIIYTLNGVWFSIGIGMKTDLWMFKAWTWGLLHLPKIFCHGSWILPNSNYLRRHSGLDLSLYLHPPFHYPRFILNTPLRNHAGCRKFPHSIEWPE